ncbi:ABC transporter permease [Sinomonas mesophila]|uniref:ABC transporter permease n=1 Tax=Sinomonas mesophila TaxID=1531955 RepID=UPI000984B93E|nr:ABC transporter permease [Sinomonas mesophila]
MSQPTPQNELIAEREILAERPAAVAPAAGEARGLSQGQIVRRRFFGHTGALIGLVAFGAIVLLSFTAVGWGPIPGWWRFNHEQVSPLVNDGQPTLTLWPLAGGEHPFGQDRIGRDLFAMTMRGTQQSITVMFLIGLVAGFIGVVVGSLAGYFRGWMETVLMRLTDVVIIIPALLLAAVMSRTAGRRDEGSWFSSFAADNGVVVLGIFLGLVLWVGLARLVRGEFLTLREREFVDAARISGASNLRIIFKHILPNAVGVVIVNVTLTMSAAILLETALSYLGVGVKAPDTSLGLLISQNQEAFSTRPWLFWWPGLFIVLICLSINFIGDGLRDAFDPRQKKFNAKRAVARERSTTAGIAAAGATTAVAAPGVAGTTAGGDTPAGSVTPEGPTGGPEGQG